MVEIGGHEGEGRVPEETAGDGWERSSDAGAGAHQRQGAAVFGQDIFEPLVRGGLPASVQGRTAEAVCACAPGACA